MALAWQNPVWPGYFADPFVLFWRGTYYAYGTGPAVDRDQDGRAAAFRILRSRNLADWELAGTALTLDGPAADLAYWAPEVAEHDGRFFLYFSCAPLAADEQHRLQVAVASHPEGPFTQEGPVFADPAIGFCIDAHPFRDPADGTWYLFFAQDFLEHERSGTGLAVVRLTPDLLRAAESPRPILTANADWQIYQRARSHYGRIWPAWHTLEGPCVVRRGDRYYCFFSGGNWQTQEYGVSFAVSNHPLGPWQHAPQAGPTVLRQRPGVLGPGHNSLLIAPDGQTEMLAYHAWDAAQTARRMFLDVLNWTPAGPECRGPTLGPVKIDGARNPSKS